MKYKPPKIIKEELGEDIYNEISDIITNAPDDNREFVIYASSEVIDTINKLIDEELKTKYGLS